MDHVIQSKNRTISLEKLLHVDYFTTVSTSKTFIVEVEKDNIEWKLIARYIPQ